MPRVPWEDPLPRYLRLTYTPAGAFTSGALGAWLVLDRWDQIISTAGYPSGYVPGIVIEN
jgi:hypothetical protein